MKKIMTCDGNEACSNTAYMFTELAGIYPITPSSPMAEHMDEWSNNYKKNIFGDDVKVIEMESEAGAAGVVHGSLSSGVLTTTFTSSQGLLLMIPNMYKIAGEMLPGVIHVAARSLATHALSIFGDHQDIYAVRSTGFCMLASSSVQDASYLSGIAHLSAIKSSLPFLHFFDGFRTSHEIQKIETIESEDYKELLDNDALLNFRNRALNINNPFTKGTAENDDIYFQATEVRNKFYDNVPDIVNEYMQKINEKTGMNYKPFNYYGCKDPIQVIVAMGSVCETIKEVIDDLVSKDYKIGLIEVHLYRPFSSKYLIDVLPDSVKDIAVLDRTKEQGSIGEPLYLDIVSALSKKNINIYGGRYGLSSKDVPSSSIKAVYDMLINNPRNNFTIGINDDVTNLSLDIDEKYKIKTSEELLIYGYGSDGMVGASKTLIKLIGDNTDKKVQGYFQYDSKKSGGVTKSHLRFSDEKIRSTYYVQNPKLVVLSKDSYLEEFDILSNIMNNGIFLINTTKINEELSNILTDENKKIIKEKNIKVFKINAYELARKCGLGNKISMIMATCIIKLLDIIDYDFACDKLKEYIKNKFYKKGENIVQSNISSIELVNANLEEIKINDINNGLSINIDKKSVYDMMVKRKGNELKTSDFLNHPDGVFDPGQNNSGKVSMADIVPEYIPENCLKCNMCSFVCPHSVIRPFILNEEEYSKAPDDIKRNATKIKVGGVDYYYTVSLSIKNCTGCGVCIETCPSKEKALIPCKLDENTKDSKQKEFDYLNAFVTEKNLFNTSTIKGSQFVKPKFAYCGACSGCGEPAYIKLLTQLFGKQLIVANATGCSSIYGGSAPVTPYSIPWANSLFEDNAEYGFGIYLGISKIRKRIYKIMSENMDNENAPLFKEWIDNSDDYEITNKVYQNINYDVCPKELTELKNYITASTIWAIGGDGWAYDIGFSGIDHVLSSNENINILVLDTQVYSNTGGQSSKASPKGAIAAFASNGKKQSKKDLARIAMAYPNAYVAQVSLGYNGMQLIKTFNEAKNHNGPSIIIAYCPCISHGIDGGLKNSVAMEKLAVESGYFPVFRRNPDNNTFIIDCNPNFDLYSDFLSKQTRYKMLNVINKEHAEELLKENKENAIKRYEYYKSLETK